MDTFNKDVKTIDDNYILAIMPLDGAQADADALAYADRDQRNVDAWNIYYPNLGDPTAYATYLQSLAASENL